MGVLGVLQLRMWTGDPRRHGVVVIVVVGLLGLGLTCPRYLQAYTTTLPYCTVTLAHSMLVSIIVLTRTLRFSFRNRLWNTQTVRATVIGVREHSLFTIHNSRARSAHDIIPVIRLSSMAWSTVLFLVLRGSFSMKSYGEAPERGGSVVVASRKSTSSRPW